MNPGEAKQPNSLVEFYSCNTRHIDDEQPLQLVPTELSTVQVHFLEVSKDKLSVKYTGDALHNNDVGSIQANHPAPKDRLIYYYEATILNQGNEAKIGIGFADATFKTIRQPGWDPDSYGYHGDDGYKYSSEDRQPYGPLFATGDIVGAGIHLSKGEIFYTYNGRHLGVAWRGIKKALFPTIGLHSVGEQVSVNFGQKPFKFDIEAMILEERQQEEKLIARMELQPGASHKIVREFLLHYGYGHTLRAFDAAAGSVGSCGCVGSTTVATSDDLPGLANGNAQSNGGNNGCSEGLPNKGAATGDGTLCNGTESMCIGEDENHKVEIEDEALYPGLGARMRVRALLKAGDVEGATANLKTRWPSVLGVGASKPTDAMFFLKLQEFIELIRHKKVDQAMAFAQQSLTPMRGISKAHDDILAEIFALVAYEDPERSPLAHLLKPEHRAIVADAINSAVVAESTRCTASDSERGHQGQMMPHKTALERLLQQLAAVHAAALDCNGGRGERFQLERQLHTCNNLRARPGI